MERTPPKFIYIRINRRCNLRCTHCDYWTRNDDDKPQQLSVERKLELLEEFAEIGGTTMVTCGGEPMLDIDEYFALMRKCRVLGLGALSVTNGTRIHNATMADWMIAEGPSEITVSLDSHVEEVHDRMRGVKGSFKVAVKALRLLLEARARVSGSTTKIYAMTIVCEEVWRGLDEFYDLVLNDIGADKLKLNIMQPSFGDTRGHDQFFGGQMIKDVDGLMRVLRACDVKYGIERNPAWLENVEMYFRSVNKNKNALAGWSATRGTEQVICNSYERNIMVDLCGMARLCFATGFPGVQLRARGDLARFWFESSVPIREKMLSCTRYCGISHSVRREPATIRRERSST
jgi:organic radical activating enzyme